MKKNEKLRWLMPVVALLALWGGGIPNLMFGR